jgi:hypothetical protein
MYIFMYMPIDKIFLHIDTSASIRACASISIYLNTRCVSNLDAGKCANGVGGSISHYGMQHCRVDVRKV